jgi:membrane dipeptidase
MKVIDTHCDTLLKLWRTPKQKSFKNSGEYQANLHRLQKGKVTLQCFAIFIPPHIKIEEKFQAALSQIKMFHTQVLAEPSMKQITCWEDVERLKPHEIGAVLTLEGADAFGNDLTKLKKLYELGVKSIGLTWNHANLCADGIGEQRGAGLTEFGRKVVHLNNEHLVWTDVSHLSERGFWDVMDIAEYPIASHSNSKSLCDHPRNLTDEQAERLFKQKGFVSVVFYPLFVKSEEKVTINDMIKHIDHFCSLGGVNQICFGSDFDGIESSVEKLEDASMYPNLINELLKHFKEDEVRGFAHQNFLNHRPIKSVQTV